MLLKAVAICLFVFLSTGVVRAQELAREQTTQANPAARQDQWPHPDLSSRDGWVRQLLLVIAIGLFVPAAIIGPWVRRRMAVEMPELHDLEERSGLTASQHEPGHAKTSE